MTQLEQLLERGLAGFPGSAAMGGVLKEAFGHLEGRLHEVEAKVGIDTSFEAVGELGPVRGPRSYADQVKDISRPKPISLSGPTPAQISEAEAYIRLRGYSDEAAQKLVAEQGAEAVLAAMKVEEAIADPSRIDTTEIHAQTHEEKAEARRHTEHKAKRRQ